MTEAVQALLQAARKALFDADIEVSALDARLLLQAASGLSHEEIIADPERALLPEQVLRFQDFIKRRLAHEPVSRILGTREFYGRQFQVTPAVLDPRADTETLVELALGLVGQGPQMVLDIGTGSGAIIITLLAERPDWTGVAVDISSPALHVAKMNALANGVSGRLHYHHGAWFEGLSQKFNLVVSNPPYIPHDDIAGLEMDVRGFDPHLALDGGPDGLYAYHAIAAGAGEFLHDDGLILVEIGAGQGPDVTAIFSHHGFIQKRDSHDLGGHLRALAFCR